MTSHIDIPICYLLADYRGPRRAGQDYRRCLAAEGVRLVDHPADAVVVIIHDQPATYPSYYRAFPVLRERYTIAYAVWEPDIFAPDLFRWFGLVDEIWTASSYCARSLAKTSNPVTVVPHVVAPPRRDGPCEQRLLTRLGLSAPPPFLFYAITRLEERKNPAAAIRAYAAAGLADRSAFIVRTPTPLPDTLAAAPGIINPPGAFDDDDIAALHGIAQSYVSPHCAEGWGLCLSDAMAYGNVVVATGYSGNMDYMSAVNSFPVGYQLDTIRSAETRHLFGFMESSAAPKWAYVDEAELAERLSQVLSDWDSLAPLRAAASAEMRRFGAVEVGAIMLQRLAVIARNPVPRAQRRPPPYFRPLG